jgi:hypothetical protein
MAIGPVTYIPSGHKIQIGVEAAIGDGAAATIQPDGLSLKITPNVESEQLIAKAGDTMPARVGFVKRRSSDWALEGPLSYDLAYLLLDGMFGEATPAGGVYDYLGSLDWVGVLEQGLAFYYGQTGLIYKVAGCLPRDLTITIPADGGPCRFSANGFGQPAADGASFAELTTQVPVLAMAHHAQLYLDPGLDATAGTTLLTDLGIMGEAKISCGREPVWHLKHQTPDAFKRGPWAGSLSLSCEADATRLAILGDILDAASEPEGFLARLHLTDGSNILYVDFAGQVLSPPDLIPEQDGIVSVDLDMVPAYGSDLETCWAAQLTIA